MAALAGLLERTGVAPDAVEDVILGHCYPTMEAPAIGRVVALDAGLPVTVPGMQLDRRCGSGPAGGHPGMPAGRQRRRTISWSPAAPNRMSNVAFYSTDMRWGGAQRRRHAARRPGPRPGHRGRPGLPGARRHAGDRGEPAPRVRHLPRPSRTSSRCSRISARWRRSRTACFAEEIVPVTVRSRNGEELIDTDEHPRADTTVETLAKLKPVLGKQDPDATVTAGNSSGQNDAAVACAS